MSVSVPEGSFHEALSPLSWLIGRWRARKADVFYPTMDAIAYNEEMEFLPTGKPVLQYRSQTWHPVKQTLLHLESGYLQILPGSDTVAFLVAHNFGATEISEGKVGNNELNLESTKISQSQLLCGVSKVTKIIRHFFLKDQLLHSLVEMETDTQPLQDHLTAVYEKISL